MLRRPKCSKNEVVVPKKKNTIFLHFTILFYLHRIHSNNLQWECSVSWMVMNYIVTQSLCLSSTVQSNNNHICHGKELYLLPPLGRWKSDIILHTDINEIGWSPNETTNQSSNSCYPNLIIERYFLTRFGNVCFSSLLTGITIYHQCTLSVTLSPHTDAHSPTSYIITKHSLTLSLITAQGITNKATTGYQKKLIEYCVISKELLYSGSDQQVLKNTIKLYWDARVMITSPPSAIGTTT